MFYKLFYGLVLFITSASVVFARGGGGGSSSGGGSSFSDPGTSSSGGTTNPFVIIVIFGVVIILIIISIIQKRKKIKKTEEMIKQAGSQDPAWNTDDIKNRVSEVFYSFQKDWSEFNVENMKPYLTEDYLKRMVLELNVLKNESRQNLMESVSINSIAILEINDQPSESNDSFVAEVDAKAKDSLIDTKNNQKLYVDSSGFTEYWHFKREENIWKLDVIKQMTENPFLTEQDVVGFAKRNNFYYDPDFGWLMMPNKGVIFSKNNFKDSDINNHVIGYFKDKIVEFYTFIPNAERRSLDNYLVAQTVLPIQYKDILVRRKRFLFNFSPSGLRRIKTESNDFDKKFCLWASKEDQINSFELLSPDFMEKIYELPFELNIEIVGNFLYFYSKSRSGVDYEKMLEILSSAFDEMKM